MKTTMVTPERTFSEHVPDTVTPCNNLKASKTSSLEIKCLGRIGHTVRQLVQLRTLFAIDIFFMELRIKYLKNDVLNIESHRK